MTTRTGTGYWVSTTAVHRFYRHAAEEALEEGRAIIGKPPLKPGDRLLKDSDGRYHIESKD